MSSRIIAESSALPSLLTVFNELRYERWEMEALVSHILMHDIDFSFFEKPYLTNKVCRTINKIKEVGDHLIRFISDLYHVYINTFIHFIPIITGINIIGGNTLVMHYDYRIPLS